MAELEEVFQIIEEGDIQNPSLRGKLSTLRQLVKEEKNLELTIEQEKLLVKLFQSRDGKTRKNLALLLGAIGTDEIVEDLFKAYKKEEQRFVKSAYLIAMAQRDYRNYVRDFKEEIEELQKSEITDENRKHMQEQLRELTKLVVAMEGVLKHKFIGSHEDSHIVLLTNKNCVEATSKQMISLQPIEFRSGVRVTTNRLQKLLPIRTYHELLFVVDGMKLLPSDMVSCAKKIVQSDLIEFLKKRHEGSTPFYFRVELKTSLPLDKKSELVKKLITYIEQDSHRELINSTTNYEIEIRLVENQEGNYYTFVKLYTIRDVRFEYRSESVSTSIKPVDAALLVELAKPYMKIDARVLDPFCGVGTMLIERQKVVKANTSYGIDYLGEAITKAHRNTELAGQIIHYVNKDFFAFTHEYVFDEIFTNMPFAMGRTTKEEITVLYERFFVQSKIHLEVDGQIIMYTHDCELAKTLAKKNGYEVIEQFPILTKKHTDLLILYRKDK
ncbi:MAG: methyltransferase [Eubacteriales bacterium]